MRRKSACTGATSCILLLSAAFLAMILNVALVRAEQTIYIRIDGSVEPSTAPIKREENLYTFNENIYGSVVVQKNDIIIDGAGQTLYGVVDYFTNGIDLSARTNVTVRNVVIKSCYYGIFLGLSLNNRIYGNTLADNEYGMRLDQSSSGNYITENNITANGGGLFIAYSIGNVIAKNNIHANYEGIYLLSSEANEVKRNNITNNHYGVLSVYSSANTIRENLIAANNDGVTIMESSRYVVLANDIKENSNGIVLGESYDNLFYHNNFLSNVQQVFDEAWRPFPPFAPSVNDWDNGYPSGGNYWSNYTGQDLNGDGFGDTPHIIDVNNQDNYPLVNPHISDFMPPTTSDDYDGLWHTSNFTITLTANDNSNGVSQTYYRINDEPLRTVTSHGQPLITSEGANNRLEYWSTDKSENEEHPHKILTDIKLDKTAPIADAGDDRTVNEDSQVTLNGSDSHDENGIKSYAWAFVDVTPQTLMDENPVYVFAAPGTYSIALTVTDIAGNQATDTSVVTVADITRPVAHAGQNQTVNVGEAVLFDGGASSDNVDIVDFEWDFGDGATAGSKTAAHTYGNPGSYRVVLTVRDAAGNAATNTIFVAVLSTDDFTVWTIGAVLAIVGLGTAVAFLLRRRNRRKATPLLRVVTSRDEEQPHSNAVSAFSH